MKLLTITGLVVLPGLLIIVNCDNMNKLCIFNPHVRSIINRVITKLLLAMAPNKSTTYEFKYEGDFNSLDALTVLHSQINFVSIINEIKDLQFPDIKLGIKIKGLEKGSLDVNHIIEVAYTSGLFVMDNYKYVQTIFKIFGDLVKLKAFLRGEKAEKSKGSDGDKIEVHLNGNNIVVHPDAFRIYQDSTIITSAFNNTSKLLSANKEIDYIEVSEQNTHEQMLKIDKEEFELLGEENPYLSTLLPNEQAIRKIGMLNIYTLSFDKKTNWEFLYEGHKFKAKISDEFAKTIDKGTSFAKGDSLEAEFEIKQQFDESVNTYVNKSFKIIRIIKHIPRNEQGNLGFPS